MQDPSAFGARQVFMLADILVKETDDAEANVAAAAADATCSAPLIFLQPMRMT